MVSFRRSRVAGGTYFFTVNLKDRQSQMLVDHVDLLRLAFQSVRARKFFTIDAIAVLPEHLHTVWTLPANDVDYAGRWRAIKSMFTRLLRASGQCNYRNERGEYCVWQRRYWEHTIRDDADLEHHINYIHFNPVKHGWVRCVADWPYSTFHRFVKLGVYSNDWAGHNSKESYARFGERPSSPDAAKRNPGK